jgi:hypothetical protein
MTQSTLNIHVTSGVVEYSAPQPPLLYTSRGRDVTVDIGPTRPSTAIDYARLRAALSVAPTRTSSADIAETRISWAVDPNTSSSAQFGMGGTRLSADIGSTRVQRNRS